MNRELMKASLDMLRNYNLGDEIFSILKNIINNDSESKESAMQHDPSIANRLNDLRDRFDSGNGGNSPMNLFPSNNKGQCHKFCLAIASREFERPRRGLESGFRGTMLDMAAYWFSCMGINETTLILTSDWDNIVFESQYRKVIDNYSIVHKKKVVIVEVGPTGYFLRYLNK
jgi:hypothetical protein